MGVFLLAQRFVRHLDVLLVLDAYGPRIEVFCHLELQLGQGIPFNSSPKKQVKPTFPKA